MIWPNKKCLLNYAANKNRMQTRLKRRLLKQLKSDA